MLDCRVAMSPRPAWINRVRLQAASIKAFYPDCTFSAYVGDPVPMDADKQLEITLSLAPEVDRVVFVDQADFDAWKGTRSEYLATMNARFHGPYLGDYLLALDADVICTRRFDELFEMDALQGVQAHVPPMSVGDWASTMRAFTGHDVAMRSEYSGWGTMVTNPSDRYGPWYPNSGVIFGPRHLFEMLEPQYHAAIGWLRQRWADTYWFDQVALALGAACAAVPRENVPLRYNFPNQHSFDIAHPAELADVRFIHYLRTDTVHRDEDFKTLDAMRRLVDRRDLGGSNELLRQRVAGLMRIFDPAPLASAEDAPWA
jgi:hypothetical protein